MNEVSYSAHISNGKSALNSKGRLSGVAKHNLRKYRSKEYDRENIVLLFGSTNLMRDVKKVYQDTFSEALEQYNQKQTRAVLVKHFGNTLVGNISTKTCLHWR